MEGSVEMEIAQEMSRVPSLSSFRVLGLGLAGEETSLEERSNGAGTSPRPWAAWPGTKVRKSQACDPPRASEKTTDPLSMWEANGGVLAAPRQWQPLIQRQGGTICKHLT